MSIFLKCFKGADFVLGQKKKKSLNPFSYPPWLSFFLQTLQVHVHMEMLLMVLHDDRDPSSVTPDGSSDIPLTFPSHCQECYSFPSSCLNSPRIALGITNVTGLSGLIIPRGLIWSGVDLSFDCLKFFRVTAFMMCNWCLFPSCGPSLQTVYCGNSNHLTVTCRNTYIHIYTHSTYIHTVYIHTA